MSRWYCWGAGGCGQLANRKLSDAVLSRAAVDLGSFDGICGGGSHTVGFVRGSEICYVWGNNESQQLYDKALLHDERDCILVPKEVKFSFKIQTVSLGWVRSCCIVKGSF